MTSKMRLGFAAAALTLAASAARSAPAVQPARQIKVIQQVRAVLNSPEARLATALNGGLRAIKNLPADPDPKQVAALRTFVQSIPAAFRRQELGSAASYASSDVDWGRDRVKVAVQVLAASHDIARATLRGAVSWEEKGLVRARIQHEWGWIDTTEEMLRKIGGTEAKRFYGWRAARELEALAESLELTRQMRKRAGPDDGSPERVMARFADRILDSKGL